MKTNQDYKNAALAVLKGNWPKAIIATIVYLAIAVAISLLSNLEQIFDLSKTLAIVIMSVSFVLTILITNPLGVGYANAFRLLYVDGDTELTSNLFRIPFSNYLHVLWGYLLVGIKTFLWTLLFIIPGIIKTFAYAMTPFILVEEPELSAKEAIAKSVKMMDGHKFDLFYLYLSFIGWFLLSILTLGIGLLWLTPYTETAVVSFYLSLKEEQAENAAPAPVSEPVPGKAEE